MKSALTIVAGIGVAVAHIFACFGVGHAFPDMSESRLATVFFGGLATIGLVTTILSGLAAPPNARARLLAVLVPIAVFTLGIAYLAAALVSLKESA